MKKIILLFVLILGNIANTYAQAYYSLEYDITFNLRESNRRYYIRDAKYTTFNGKSVWMPAFSAYQAESNILVKGSMDIPASDGFIKEITFNTARQKYSWPAWYSSCSEDIYVVRNTSPETSCFNLDGRNNLSWGCLNHGATVRVFHCYPKLSISPNKDVMTEDEKLVIQATPGFPDHVYKWRYSFIDTQSPSPYNWKSVPASCYSTSAAKFEASAVDLLGLAEAMKAVGKNIAFCIDLGCGKISDIKTISVKMTTPGIESLIPKNLSCPGADDGGMLITLDRDLYPGEVPELYKILAEGGIDRSKVDFERIDSKTLRAKNLIAGTYTIILNTTNGDVAFSQKSNATMSNISITEPDPLTFSIDQKQAVLCNGGNGGSFKVTAAGGTPAYRLKWRLEGAADFTETDNLEVTSLAAGVYEYYITDANDCEPRDQEGFLVIKTVEITEPDRLVVTHLEDKTANPSGNGLSNGYITIQVEGGTANGSGHYTVVWKNRDTQAILTTVENSIPGSIFESKLKDIPAGDYTVTVTDENGCSVSINKITIEEPFTIKGTIVQTQRIACYGDGNAALEVTSVSGGVPATTGDPYRFDWYKLTSDVDSVWQGGQSAITNLDPGRYVVTITDSSTPANEKNLYYTVTQPDPLLASVSNVNVSCYEGNNGSISINVSGGTAPYLLYYAKGSGAYSTRQSNNNFVLNSLTADTYSFHIEDNNGCQALINGNTEKTVAITQPATAFTISSERVKHPTGSGRSDGRIILKITGGIPFASTPQYSVVWRNSSGLIASDETIGEDGLFTTTLNNLPQGAYTVQINGDTHPGASGPCILSKQFVLEEPRPLSVQWTVSKPVSCNGTADGEITATVSGGIPNEDPDYPYIYIWYTVADDGTEELIPGVTGKVLADTGAGRYKLAVSDYSDPVNTKDFYYTLTEPAVVSVSVSTSPVSCFGGSNGILNVTATGGTAPYKLFYKLAGDEAGSYLELPSANGRFTVNNLKGGDYALYVADKNNCEVLINGNPVDTATVAQPEKALSVVSRIVRGPSGSNRADGYIALRITGGTAFTSGPLYQVVWRNEDGQAVSADNTVEGDTLISKLEGLPVGSYSVEIKDRMYSGATGGCYLFYTISLDEPEPISVWLENTKTVDCFGELTGELVAHATGGVPFLSDIPYIYKWYRLEADENNPGEAKRVPVEGNGSVLSGLGAGVYVVEIEDSCTPPGVNAEVPDFEITQPPLLNVGYAKNDISCFGGRNGFIHVSVSGGVGGYRMYCKQENVDSDFRPVPASAGGRSFNMDSLSAGVYRFYIQDANLCYANIDGTVYAEVVLSQPQKALSIDDAVLVNPSKYGGANGSIAVRLSGGTPFADGSYAVIWKHAGNNQTLASESRIESGVFISTARQLPDGKYTVEIRDRNYYDTDDAISNAACITADSYTLIQPDEFEAIIEETVVSCSGSSDGALRVKAKGGVVNPAAGALPYKYQWYKKDASGAYVAVAGGAAEALSGISGGDYRIDLEDYSWLPNTLSLEWRLVEPDTLKATATSADILCGQTTPVSVTVSGGTPPYTYQWSTGDETGNLGNMYPGVYMVFVTDAHGCMTTALSRITSPGDVSLTGETFDPVCNGGASGKVEISVSGGTPPYTYQWSNGSAGKDLTGVPAGIYTVVVKDRDGCAYTESFTLNDPEPVKLDLGEDKILCAGQTWEPEPVYDDPESTCLWTGDNGFYSTDKRVVLDRAGTYELTITDRKGCTATDRMTIVTKDYDISCDMVVTSAVALNDTVVIVNITSPEPDRIEWLISPDDPIEVLYTTDEVAVVIFRQEGEYNIGLRTHVADCFSDVIKPVKVGRAGENPADAFGVSDIKKFVAYPNPSDGRFRVDVELDKQANIRLRLISIAQGHTLSSKTWQDSDSYSIEYSEPVPAGAYILMLETPAYRRSVKLIIH